MKINQRLLPSLAALMLAFQLLPGASLNASAQEQMRSLAAENLAEASTAIPAVTESPETESAPTAPPRAASQPAQGESQLAKTAASKSDLPCTGYGCVR